jgi:hypothetical protein
MSDAPDGGEGMTRLWKIRLGDSGLALVCWLAWIVVGLLPALFGGRYFYADGAYFFLQILERHSVFFPAEGRAVTYILTQWPAALAAAAGCTDIGFLSRCFGAGLMLVPAGLHGAAIMILLQRGLKMQAAAYVMMLWLMMGYGGLCIVTDSHTPAALFLLAVVLVASSVPERSGPWLALIVIGALSFYLYEFWAFYAIGLLLLLAWRLRPRWSGMSVRARLAGFGTLCVFTASGAVNAWRLLHSSANPNQVSLLQMLRGTTYPIYLALITTWFLGVCLHFMLETRFRGRPLPGILLSGRARIWVLGVSFALLSVLSGLQHNTMIRYSYPFRTLNLILPLVYAGWLILATGRGESARIPAGGRGLLLLLTVCLVANENWMTSGWREYQAWAGDVPHMAGGRAYAAQSPATPMARAWIFPWSHSAQSFVAQSVRSGSVKVIAYDPGAGWDPYGPDHEELLRSIAARYGIGWK